VWQRGAFMPYVAKVVVWLATNLSTLRKSAANAHEFIGSDVPPAVPWALSFLNGAFVLGFLFGRLYPLLPGQGGVAKGFVFGLLSWIAMGWLFFPMLGLAFFAAQAGFDLMPAFFSLLMLLTCSIIMGIAYSVLGQKQAGEP